jgi:hypothetical protein
VINDELAAVTVPYGLIKAGLSLAICSNVDTRIPLSRLTTSAAPEKKQILFHFYIENILPGI